MSSISAPVLPAGVILEYGAAAAPAGWLLCDGSAVSRTTYAALFAAISTTFGAGNGTTTFNVPDCRGRAPIGAGAGSGLTNRALASTVGEETHTLVTGEIPAHAHTINVSDPGHFHQVLKGDPAGIGQDAISYATFGGASYLDVNDRNAKLTELTATGVTAGATNTGGDGAHQNMQPSLALTFIIKT